MRPHLAAAFLFACLACAGMPPVEPARSVRATPAAGPPRPAPAYGDSCAPAIEHARREPLEPLIQPPVPADPERMVPPRLPPRLRSRGIRIAVDLQVDSAGGVTAVHVTPDVDPTFTASLLEHFGRARMLPALLHGCGVPGRTEMMVEYVPER